VSPPDRRPRWVYEHGDDPDPRFSLANERTALAWVRTALALVAGGAALTSLASIADLPGLLDVLAALACLGGGGLAVRAALGWARVERALREARALPAPRSLGLVAGLVVVLAVALAGYAVGRAF
jgi:putative membrane protein